MHTVKNIRDTLFVFNQTNVLAIGEYVDTIYDIGTKMQQPKSVLFTVKIRR